MTSADKSRHVKVTEGGQTVAAAEVDAVIDLPEVQASSTALGGCGHTGGPRSGACGPGTRLVIAAW